MNEIHDRLGCVPSCATINFLDVIAGNITAGRFSLARDEEYQIEWAGFPVEHLALHGLTSESQSPRLVAEAINVARIACFGVAHLVKFQWLILKTKFVSGRRGQQVTGMPINVTCNRRIDKVLVESDAIVVSGNGNRVSIDSRSYKVSSVLESRFICGFSGLIADHSSSVFCERCQQVSPVRDEWQQSVCRNGNNWSDNTDHVGCMRDEAGKNAAFGDTLYIKAAAFISGVASVLVRHCPKGRSQIEQIKRMLVLDFDDHSCRRLAHILGPHRYSGDVTTSVEQFNGEREASE